MKRYNDPRETSGLISVTVSTCIGLGLTVIVLLEEFKSLRSCIYKSIFISQIKSAMMMIMMIMMMMMMMLMLIFRPPEVRPL